MALFFLALLPQFIEPNTTSNARAFVFLGCVLNFNATLWNLFVAWSAARMGRRIKDSRRFRVWINRVIGGVFVCLGARLALVTD